LLAGILRMLAVIVSTGRVLRSIRQLGSRLLFPWQTSIAACVPVVVVLGMYRWLGHSDLVGHRRAPSAMIDRNLTVIGGRELAKRLESRERGHSH